MWTQNLSSDVDASAAIREIENIGYTIEIKYDLLLATKGTAKWYIYNRDQLVNRLQTAQPWSNSNNSAGSPPKHDTDRTRTTPDERQSQSVQELESEVNRLRERGKLAVKQRDEWERRALAAEARTMELARSASQAEGDPRFRQLRQMLAQEFHPDHAKAEGLEKMVRQEIFKQLWPKVEEITNGRKSR